MSEKQNIVYFLGAGSSYCFGYPLTWQMMPDILAKLKTGTLFNAVPGLHRTQSDSSGERELLDYIELVYPGLKGIDLDKHANRVPNITEVFSFVDHLCFYSTPHHPKMSETKLTAFRILLNRALAELIQLYEFDVNRNKEADADKMILKEKFVQSIRQQYNENNINIITTNYDMVIDLAFVNEATNNEIDYGFPYRDIFYSTLRYRPSKTLLNYYKLHGSLNWLMCNLCSRYYINPYCSIVHQEFRDILDDDNRCICNVDMRLRSVMVPPSTVRDIRDSNLLQIWKEALESIRTADKLIMIGYSLPAEDLAIKSIILRGLNGNPCKDDLQLEVVQFGEKDKPNYQNVFGTVLKEENYFELGLEDYLKLKHTSLF